MGRSPVVAWAAAGHLPAGFKQVEQFAVLPGAPGRSFLVPLAARWGTSAALTSYNALRPPRRRLARRMLALGLRAGLTGPLLRDRVDVGVAADAGTGDLPDVLLREHLCAMFGRTQVVVAIGGGSGPYRKPVLQVFGADGTPLGYVKVGWNDWTRDAVRCEAAALRRCAARPLRLGVPALLDQSVWCGLDLLVTAPLPARVRRVGRGAELPGAGLLREISELSECRVGELAASPWWTGLRARIRDRVSDPEAHFALAEVADRLERAAAQVPLGFGYWHGDLVPWNMARLGARLYVWDWESSAPDAPLGFDALHFYFQSAFVAQGRPLAEAAAHAGRRAAPTLHALGVEPADRSLITVLHLLELAVRHEEARSSTGDVDERFYPAVTRWLDRALAVPSRPSAYDDAGLAS
jgi:hypothetical protein